MIHLTALPTWAAIAVALLLLLGSGLTVLGTVGMLRLGSFYERIHAPTLGTSGGTTCIVLASIICFSVLQSRMVVHELLILVFVTVTTPVTLMLLGRAALYRDRTAEDPGDIPPFEAMDGDEHDRPIVAMTSDIETKG